LSYLGRLGTPLHSFDSKDFRRKLIETRMSKGNFKILIYFYTLFKLDREQRQSVILDQKRVRPLTGIVINRVRFSSS
jgi:hypothetical protein